MQTISLAPEMTSSRLGFGCAGLMRDASGPRRQALLAGAFEEGIRHFDVARMYGLGAAEGELGKFARTRRDQLVIATKFGIQPSSASGRFARFQGPARRLMASNPAVRGLVKRHAGKLHEAHRYDAAGARDSLQTSLRELQTDYVDILFLHGPSSADTLDLPEVCAYLEDARQAGHLRAWGVAGDPDPCVSIKRSLPAAAILQVRDDIFRDAPLADDLRPCVTFGVLAGIIEPVLEHVCRSPETRRRWSSTVGIDCGSAESVASLLLRESLDANPSAVVLFSTTRPERLRGSSDLVASPETESGRAAIRAFKQLVADELTTVPR